MPAPYTWKMIVGAWSVESCNHPIPQPDPPLEPCAAQPGAGLDPGLPDLMMAQTLQRAQGMPAPYKNKHAPYKNRLCGTAKLGAGLDPGMPG